MHYPRSRRIVIIGFMCWSALTAAIVVSAIANGPRSEEKAVGFQKGAGAVQDVPEATIKTLLEKAKAASKNSYSPYSKFRVGAAVLTESGDIYSGCNVENASYGLTICAERNAVFHMVAQGKQKIKALAIYTPTQTPTAPCGACRQVINEFGPDAVIAWGCDGPQVLKKKLSELLPDAFGPANLK